MLHKSPKQHENTLMEFYCVSVEMVLAGRTSMEFSPPSAKKGTGLEFLCHYLNISLEKTISVGDSFNKLSIMNKAGLPIVVENAVSKVRTASAKIVSDNNRSGVAEVVERFWLM